MDFIDRMPKTELHLHIEGSLEPELMFKLAEKNRIRIPYNSVEKLRSAYNFSDLQSFLDIYYSGAEVLKTEGDFYELTTAYIGECKKQNIRHTEIFFDPQTHTERGTAIETVINGISAALEQAEKRDGITSRLIMCFLRHLDETSAFETLKSALPFREKISAVGLDSSERGNPPVKFKAVFEEALNKGFLTVAHAGEEGPPSFIRDALYFLKVSRIDHGVRAWEDPELVKLLSDKQVPLTVCPLSNIKLRVFETMEDHNIKKLLDSGVCVTVNSDDPAYFGGYMNENYKALTEGLNLGYQDLYKLAVNGINASFIDDRSKRFHISELDDYFSKNCSEEYS